MTAVEVDYVARLRGLAAEETELMLDAGNDRQLRNEAALTADFCLGLAERFAKLDERPELADLAGRVEDTLGFLDRIENLNPLGTIPVRDVVRSVREYLGGGE